MRRLGLAALLLASTSTFAMAACPEVLLDCPSINANLGKFGNVTTVREFGSWLNTLYNGHMAYFDGRGNFKVGTVPGKAMGITVATRASDATDGLYGSSISAFRHNDAASGGETAYFSLATAPPSKGGITVEIENANGGVTVPQSSYAMGNVDASGNRVTASLWLGAGGEVVDAYMPDGTTPTTGALVPNPSSLALGIVTQCRPHADPNSCKNAKFDKAIIIAQNATTYTYGVGGTHAVALEMATNQDVRWIRGGVDPAIVSGWISSTNVNGLNTLGMVFTDNGTTFQKLDGTVMLTIVPSTPASPGPATAGGIFTDVPIRVRNAITGGVTTSSLISNNGTNIATPVDNTVLQVQGQDGHDARILIDTSGTGFNTGVVGRISRGTADTPTAIKSNDVMFALGGFGYGATGYSPTARSRFQFNAAEDWTDTAQGANVTLHTTPIGSTTLAEVARFNNSGALLIGTTIPVGATKLAVAGTASVTGLFAGTTPGVTCTGTPTALFASILGIVTHC